MIVQMEEKDSQLIKHKNGNSLCTQIETQALVWKENITVIDFGGRNLKGLDESVKLPANLSQLNLSNNKLIEVPAVVYELEKLVVLNLSYNKIVFFNGSPKSCHILEVLDISHNSLEGPPYWIWSETPKKLTKLDLSNNVNITNSLKDGYMEEFLQYSTLVTDVDVHNCHLSKFTQLLATFPNAISLCLGTDEYSYLSANSLLEIPCQGLDKCCQLRSLNVSNTHLYTVKSSIDMYKNLVEINLAQNDLSGLPNEFCNLENLETCVLSYNKILYLPEDMCNLQKLVHLYLNNNDLCMLPDSLSSLKNLKTLDLYNNNLNDVPVNLSQLEELDLAFNYCEEPDDADYIVKKEKLRLLYGERYNGRKEIVDKSDGYSELDSEDDEELYDIFHNGKSIDLSQNPDPPSSPEDWDSDEYWVPCHQSTNKTPPGLSPWLVYVKQKMKDGNFCPMDAHVVPVAEKVNYENMCNPKINHESDGQFDDYSSDDS